MIYNRALCVAGLFVTEYAWLYAPLSLIYSTAGWQSNKRMSMGDLTSTNIPDIILLKHSISVSNPWGPQRHSDPDAHVISCALTHRKKKCGQKKQRWHGNTLLSFSALLVNIPHGNYFTIPQLCMTDVCLYRPSASSVLKHISVCLTKHPSCYTNAPDQSQADFPPEAYASVLHVSSCSYALPCEGASSWKLAVWIVKRRKEEIPICFAFHLALHWSFLSHRNVAGL